MSYILLMTIAGSILFVGYLLWEKLIGEHMSQAFRYRALMLVMLAYLVPWVWLKGPYKSVGALLQRNAKAVPVSGHLVLDEAAIRSTDSVTLTPDYSRILLVAGIWGAAAVAILILRCMIYFLKRRKLLKLSGSCEEEIPRELLERLRKELRLKRSIRIRRMKGGDRSFTIGAVKPVVFLQRDIREGELELILRHEFIHIARGDMFLKLVMDFVCCLHWYNPLVYLLAGRLERVSEKACDERVSLDRSEDEREIYAKLIVRSMQAPKRKVLFGSFLASGEKYAEERVRVIMNKRKMKRWEKIAVAGVFAAMVFADSLTAMAYPRVIHVEEATAALAEDSVKGRGSLIFEKSNGILTDNFYPVVYDEELITAEGEIREAKGQERLFCFHNWQEGTYQTHVRDDNGGCTIKLYDCTYCLNCDTIRIKELVFTGTYVKCPHDDIP